MLRRRFALRIIGIPPLTGSLRAGWVGQHGQAGACPDGRDAGPTGWVGR